MTLKLYFSFFVLFFFLFCFSSFSIAQATKSLDVVINEIAWMGSKVEGIESKNWWRYEWLELYNNTNSAFSLEGWKIELYRADLDWTLELKGTIPGQSYFLIVASDKIFSNYDLNYSSLGGKFNNNGQKVFLKDNLGNIVDEIDCFSSKKWFAGDSATKQTMERKNPKLSDATNWQSSQNPGGTPKTKNSEQKTMNNEQKPEQKETEETPVAEVGPPQVGSPQDYPGGIIFSEILPSPIGPDAEEEWIEIFNQNSFEVDLAGWKIKDVSGKITTYTFPKETKILPQGFLVLPRKTTKITLNNGEDGLTLASPDGNIIDKINYKKAPQGESFNRVISDWFWSANLTPGATNIAEKTEKNLTPEDKEKRELAAVGEPIRQAQGKQIPKSLSVFLIALSLAIFSGVMILILKKKIKKGLPI